MGLRAAMLGGIETNTRTNLRSPNQIKHMKNSMIPTSSRSVFTFGLLCILLSGAGRVFGGTAANSTNVFSPEAITALLWKVNEYQIAHPVVKGTNRNWVRATWYTGVMAAGEATGDNRYIDQALRWSEENGWKQGIEPQGPNIITCSQTYLELYFLKTNRAFIEPTIRWLDSGRSNTPSGGRDWHLEHGLKYSDALYVGAPTLAMLAKATGNPKYLDWMNDFFWDVHEEIFDQEAGLYYRDKRYIPKTSANGKKVFWSRGNGWVFATFPRILPYLPPNDPNRAKYEAVFKQMAAAVAKEQQPDGLWRPNLADAEEFPMPESSGTAFFCYGLAWGVRNGLLDRAEYLPVIEKSWRGLAGCVSAEGKVQWGQLVGLAPVPVKQEDTHEYVTGTFLLAGSEMLKLYKAGMLPAEGKSPPKSATAPSTP